MPTQQQSNPKRWLARCVTVNGEKHALQLVELTDDRRILLSPFTHETHSTVYVSAITVQTDKDGHIITFEINQ